MEPESSTQKACFRGWPLSLWHIPFVLFPCFSEPSLKGLIGGIPECLEVGGDGEAVLGLPHIFK